MSIDNAPKLTRIRALAFAVETTTGLAATIGDGDGVTAFFAPELKHKTEAVEREEFGTLSPIEQAMGARSGTCTFETEMIGGTSPVWMRLLQGCGYAVTGGVWSPVDSMVTLTINHYRNGRLRQLTGCMGNCVFTLKRGQKARAKWTFTGVRQTPTDAAIITPTYIRTVAPRVGMTTFNVGGYVPRIPDLEVDLGNEVVLREDVTALDSLGNPTGYRSALIVRRKPMVKMAPEAVALATIDWTAIYDATTLKTLTATWGNVATNIFSFAAPNLQVDKDPEDGDRSSILTETLEFLCVRGASAGQDELTLTQS